MSRVMPLSLLFLICVAFYSSASAFDKRPAGAWNYYHFDGISFTSGPALDGSAFVAVREKVRPVVLTAQSSQIEQIPLPEGAGVIAGIRSGLFWHDERVRQQYIFDWYAKFAGRHDDG